MINPTMDPMLFKQDDGAEPDPTGAVLKVQHRTADVLAGYQTMVDKAEPSFKPVVQRFLRMHERHNSALSAILVRLGQEPDVDGTFMGTINQAVVSLRSIFDEIDGGIMDSIRNGENHVLEAFQDAVEDSGLAPTDRQELRDMQNELTTLLQDTRDLD